MEIYFHKRFEKDLKKIKDKKQKKKIAENISNIEVAIKDIQEKDDLQKIPKITKLVGYNNYFRIRIGDYRIGIEIIKQNNKNVFVFMRILHRSQIYNKFP